MTFSANHLGSQTLARRSFASSSLRKEAFTVMARRTWRMNKDELDRRLAKCFPKEAHVDTPKTPIIIIYYNIMYIIT